jgi:transposase
MTRRKISKDPWAALKPLIPVFTPSPKGGRRRTIDDRAALNGTLYVLQTGIPQEDLPQKLGFDSGMTCWQRLGGCGRVGAAAWGNASPVA